MYNIKKMGIFKRRRKKIGLALGGGAARGWAHIGVINAFQEAEIPSSSVLTCKRSNGLIPFITF